MIKNVVVEENVKKDLVVKLVLNNINLVKIEIVVIENYLNESLNKEEKNYN